MVKDFWIKGKERMIFSQEWVTFIIANDCSIFHFIKYLWHHWRCLLYLKKDENLLICSKQPSFSAYIYAHGSSMKLHNCIYTLQDTLINLVCGCCLITLETCVQSCLKLTYGRSAAAFMSYRRSTHRVLMSKFKYSKPIQQKNEYVMNSW